MSEDTRKPKLGLVGLGLMGSAMAEMLLADGYPLTVWNRESEVLADFERKGAKIADDPAGVAAAADVVLLCVLDTHAVEEVVFGRYGVGQAASRDKVLVDHSTAMPAETAAMADRLLQETGMRWVDAPVSGGPAFARECRLTVMAGGSQSDFDRVAPIFGAYAANITRIGGTGAGQMAKVINQAISGVSYVLMAEVLRMAEESGIDATRLPECLAGGHADSTMLHYAYPKMLARNFDPPASLASQMLKDLRNVGKEAQRFGLDLPLIETALARFETYVEKGGGGSETASIYRDYLKTT